MSHIQEIISEISGYNGLGEPGARNDGYYELNDQDDRLDYIDGIAEYLEYELTDDERAMIENFISVIQEMNSQDDAYQAWKLLD